MNCASHVVFTNKIHRRMAIREDASGSCRGGVQMNLPPFPGELSAGEPPATEHVYMLPASPSTVCRDCCGRLLLRWLWFTAGQEAIDNRRDLFAVDFSLT